MLFALSFVLTVAATPRTELPSVFSGGRAFVTPRVVNSERRLKLWIDSDGDGFLSDEVTAALRLRTAADTAYLPDFEEADFPPVTGNHGALPLFNTLSVRFDPIFAGIDGQLGWSWLNDRIWTIDYVGHHVYWDHSVLSYGDAARVPLTFDSAHRFPQLDIEVDGTTYRAALDTAATVALSLRTTAVLADGEPPVRATSFIPESTLAAWHAAHPHWRYIADAGSSAGISLIRVPNVRAGRVTFSNVWFSTRHLDDVFEGESVQAKLGPTAFGRCAVTIDYVHDAAFFECAALPRS